MQRYKDTLTAAVSDFVPKGRISFNMKRAAVEEYTSMPRVDVPCPIIFPGNVKTHRPIKY